MPHSGPTTDHFDGQHFFNPGQAPTDKSFRELLHWRMSGTRAPWPAPPPPRPGTIPAPTVPGLAITMIGHASLLIQVANLNILVDPVWSDRASPLPFAGPKRWDAPGIPFEALPKIHTVLLTHNHYDHLDAPTLKRLAATHAPQIIAPIGNEALIARLAPNSPRRTADWADTIDLAPTLKVTLHPAYHWSARTPFDRRKALWSGFVIQSADKTIYLAGDTAYGNGAPFELVKTRFGPPTVAILPIGAYEPRWFMQNQHMNPEDAVQALLKTGAQQALGVHWGTFQLTDEPREAPLEALAAACNHHAIDPARFRALTPGDVWQ